MLASKEYNNSTTWSQLVRKPAKSFSKEYKHRKVKFTSKKVISK